MSDDELERLKARRLEEMQKNLATQNVPADETPSVQSTPRDILLNVLGYRGEEVLQNAEQQFPRETYIIVSKLGELVQSSQIQEPIDGGQLLALFRSVGVNVRMDTKIHVEKDGKFVSLSDKLGMDKS